MSLVAEINRKFNQSKNLRMEYERSWKLDLSFYHNRQWVVYDSTSRRVVDWMPNNKKPRLTANIIMPVVRAEYAKLTRSKPSFRVEATTSSREDVAKAKVGGMFLEYLWDTKQYDASFKKALLWCLICGPGFVKVYYDPNAGPVVTVQGQRYPLGEVLIDYCSPFELFIDPFARSLDEASWVVQARLRSLDYVEAKYGKRVSGGAYSASGIIGGDAVTGIRSNRYGAETNLPSTLVKEYWEKPSAKYPQGRYAVTAGTTSLYEGDNPYYDICPIPFSDMQHIPVADSLYGESVVSQLRQVNVMYNKIRSDVVENTVKLSNPPMTAPVNAFLKPPEFEPGEIMYYNPLVGGEIKQVEIQPYNQATMNILMRLWQERDDISGQSEVSRGGVPRGVRSAQAVAYLLEQDETKLAVTARSFEAMVGRAMGMALKLARRFYTVPRLIRIVGDDKTWQTKLFKNEDIPADADVRVKPSSTLPKSRIQQQQELMDLWDRQILKDPRLLLRLSDYGSNEEIYQDIELDTAQAQRENQMMLGGENHEVEDYENHPVHIVEHNRLRKTVEYEKLPEPRKELFRRHVKAHEDLLRQQAPQQQATSPMPGQRPQIGGNV